MGDGGCLSDLILAHITARPQVSLHFSSANTGDDVVVLRGHAERADDLPATDASPEFLAKYLDEMIRVTGNLESFAADLSVPIRIGLTRVRGY